MSEQQKQGTGADDNAPVITQADVARARAEGATAGQAEGAKAERTRIGAILTHAEAAGREAQARTLALETDLNAEQAAKVLASSPKSAAAPANAFAAAMATTANPKVGAEAGTDDGVGDEQAEAQRCVALYQGARRK